MQTKGMTPTELSETAGISVPYASQLISGARKDCSLTMAFKIYDATSLQFGPLAGMSERDINSLRRLLEKARAA